MESKYLNFLLNENEINKIANDVGTMQENTKIYTYGTSKDGYISPNNIAKDLLNEISLNLFEKSDILVWGSVSISDEPTSKEKNVCIFHFS